MSLISQFFGDETFDPFLSMINRCPVLTTPTDWKETNDAHVFVSDLPGLKKEDVKVEVVDEGRVLQISGERHVDDNNEKEKENNNNNNDDNKQNNDNKQNKWHRVERWRGKFQRRFKLPQNAKVDEVKASMENGVLVVIVPKQEVKKPETKVIQIEGN